MRNHQPAPIPAALPQTPADAVAIQVPVGRILAGTTQWQVVFDGRTKPSIYRLHNGSRRSAAGRANAMVVEVDGASRTLSVQAGASIDVLAKTIRVKAGRGSATVVEGWYVLIS